jgi:hypothetical protein
MSPPRLEFAQSTEIGVQMIEMRGREVKRARHGMRLTCFDETHEEAILCDESENFQLRLRAI